MVPTPRTRRFCPVNGLQAPQSSQSANLQSTLQSLHSVGALHSLISFNGFSQGLPPNKGFVTIDRERDMWPVPHSALHSPHESHADSWQSVGAPLKQPSGSGWPGAGLHLTTSEVGPSQGMPPLALYRTMVRERACMPLHADGHSGGSHAVHMPNTQSCCTTGPVGSQSTSAEHASYSRFSPSAGLPHSLASIFCTRLRERTPPMPHVTLHLSHGPQSSHMPSMQDLESQEPGQDPKACTSSEGPGLQGAPEPVCGASIFLERRR
mmetsp:Transcript_17777/g.50628  ORF Transcript_17777/g.50628 Transcript_17777/m.50628 type:complete len:265 (-) Transcript_17777:3576-4370(-)